MTRSVKSARRLCETLVSFYFSTLSTPSAASRRHVSSSQYHVYFCKAQICFCMHSSKIKIATPSISLRTIPSHTSILCSKGMTQTSLHPTRIRAEILAHPHFLSQIYPSTSSSNFQRMAIYLHRDFGFSWFRIHRPESFFGQTAVTPKYHRARFRR